MLIGSERVPVQKNRAVDPYYKLLSYDNNKEEMKHFSKKFVISRVFMVKGPEIGFVISKVL